MFKQELEGKWCWKTQYLWTLVDICVLFHCVCDLSFLVLFGRAPRTSAHHINEHIVCPSLVSLLANTDIFSNLLN